MDKNQNNKPIKLTTLEKQSFFKNLKMQQMRGVAYDTAWIARILRNGKTVFPKAIKWLQKNQHLDGSWGAEASYYHDKLLSTVSALLALSYNDRNQKYIERGEKYMWENIHNLKKDHIELNGFELLFPTLMKEAEEAGLNLPYDNIPYLKERERKLSQETENLIYSKNSNLSFFLEFLGDSIDLNKVKMMQLKNGSWAACTSTTAFILSKIHNDKALRYLHNVVKKTSDGGSIMEFYPFDIYEISAILYNCLLGKIPLRKKGLLKVVESLQKSLSKKGVGFTGCFVPDLDDTALVIRILFEFNQMIESSYFKILEQYEGPECFYTFEFEITHSPSTNAHVLDLIKHSPDFLRRKEIIEKLVKFLKHTIVSQSFWVDKWHLSPYYATSHAIIALIDIDNGLAEKAVRWILETQGLDGAWGHPPTAEETAYALLALLHYYDKVERIDETSIIRGRNYLISTQKPSGEWEYPRLWMAKVLFSPTTVIKTAILSSMYLSEIFTQRL